MVGTEILDGISRYVGRSGEALGLRMVLFVPVQDARWCDQLPMLDFKTFYFHIEQIAATLLDILFWTKTVEILESMVCHAGIQTLLGRRAKRSLGSQQLGTSRLV